MPDTERELADWMLRNGQMVDGKGTYQYKKIEATLAHCRSFRTCGRNSHTRIAVAP